VELKKVGSSSLIFVAKFASYVLYSQYGGLIQRSETTVPSSQFAQTLPPRRIIVIVMTALLTGNLLGFMDQTIVSTAGPTMISYLGGLEVYAWVFSAYILAQTISMPIFGRLSDIFGRNEF